MNTGKRSRREHNTSGGQVLVRGGVIFRAKQASPVLKHAATCMNIPGVTANGSGYPLNQQPNWNYA